MYFRASLTRGVGLCQLMTVKKTRCLLLRLSSFGDVVLASAALAALPSDTHEVVWVIASRFQGLLQAHPSGVRVIPFDSRDGFFGWYQLCRTLWNERFDIVFDLHGSLRTRILRILFRLWSLKDRRSYTLKLLPKQRLRELCVLVFKGLVPKRCWPTPWVERYALGIAHARPDFTFYRLNQAERLVALMPSSRWPQKAWSTASYVECIRLLPCPVIVLGTKEDRASHVLCQALDQASIPYIHGITQSVPELIAMLSRTALYVGSDTGIAHLAEAMGIPVFVLFGPTHPMLGFGPWRTESQSLGSPLGCRPCSKSGRICFRFWDKRACLKRLEPKEVAARVIHHLAQ